MSHRWNCPTEWEARREGERASDYGRSRYSNPYREQFGESHCEDAERSWDRGHRYREEQREEEAAAERAAERHASEQRACRLAQEEEYYRRQEEAHYAEQQEQPPEEMPAEGPKP